MTEDCSLRSAGNGSSDPVWLPPVIRMGFRLRPVPDPENLSLKPLRQIPEKRSPVRSSYQPDREKLQGNSDGNRKPEGPELSPAKLAFMQTNNSLTEPGVIHHDPAFGSAFGRYYNL